MWVPPYLWLPLGYRLTIWDVRAQHPNEIHCYRKHYHLVSPIDITKVDNWRSTIRIHINRTLKHPLPPIIQHLQETGIEKDAQTEQHNLIKLVDSIRKRFVTVGFKFTSILWTRSGSSLLGWNPRLSRGSAWAGRLHFNSRRVPSQTDVNSLLTALFPKHSSFLIFPTVYCLISQKRRTRKMCFTKKETLIVKKEKESRLYLLFSFEYKLSGRGENNQLQVHQDMKIYIYNIYKMSLFTPVCTLFTRRPGSEVLEDEALLHHVSETFSMCKKQTKK